MVICEQQYYIFLQRMYYILYLTTILLSARETREELSCSATQSIPLISYLKISYLLAKVWMRKGTPQDIRFRTSKLSM